MPNFKNDGKQRIFQPILEDSILAYVFQDIEKGFFVEVGVNDQIIDNATHYFHIRGWKGYWYRAY